MKRTSRTSAAPRSAGASHSRTSSGDRFNSYLAHHRQVAGDSLQRLLRTPTASAMTWLVIGIALALPVGLLVALNNLEAMSRGWDGAAQISLFMQRDAAPAQTQSLADSLQRRGDIERVELISPEQALAEFQALSGYGEVIDHLDNNPLPAVIVVRPLAQGLGAETVASMLEELRAQPGVEQAVLDLEWLQRLYAMMQVGKRLALALAVLLALGVLLVIGNTIRLAIEGRRDEIVIVKLVGATDAFVRRPFLYTGVWYGLGGGLVAWLLVNLSLWWLSGPVAQLSGLYGSGFSLNGMGIGGSLLLWCSATLLGLAGAWLAVGRHLGDIEPR